MLINSSSASFRLLGGMKLDLFLTKEISLSSVPSKNSASLNFLLNSFESSFNSCVFPNFGVGVNLSPLFNNDISASVSFLLDKFIILMSLYIFHENGI